MAPQPSRHNPQQQKLTTALKAICQDYPAGGGILRELLQNADDAGASRIKFVLDTRSHATSELLVPGLEGFQGPALLAYNDALFTDKDFGSLSTIGDSGKMGDASATGKFGRGFNSVYNWTDSPGIISGSTLLLLDPHHSWSSSFSVPGGPCYDFTQCPNDQAMGNQLAAYSSINYSWEQPFNGTIIRIPLRTQSQADCSAIRKEHTTNVEVHSSMESFALEMRLTGLLFLKNVQEVTLFVDKELLASTKVINGVEVKKQKQLIKQGLKDLSKDGKYSSRSFAFEMHVKHTSATEDLEQTFLIQHLFESDTGLSSWAASQKLFRWVALAAPLQNASAPTISGELFSVLPLHIPIKQPIHIHALFSISPDRARLHGPNDGSVQDQRPQKWNEMLFKFLIPKAWAKLLEIFCQMRPTENALHLWPQDLPKPRELWDKMCGAVVDVVSHEDLPVWYTDIGHVSLRVGLLTSESVNHRQRQAFCEAKVPVVYLPETLLLHAQRIPKAYTLSPLAILKRFHQSNLDIDVSESSKLILLDYLLSDIPVDELADFELFPFEDGTFRSTKLRKVFLHRDQSEKALYSREPQQNLDINRLTSQSLKSLRTQVITASSVRFRQAEDLRDYFMSEVFGRLERSEDTIVVDGVTRALIIAAWNWIWQIYTVRMPLQKGPETLRWGSDRRHSELPSAVLRSLWLLPLTNGRFRRLEPLSKTMIATHVSSGVKRDIIFKIAEIGPTNAPLILDADALSSKTLDYLLSASKIDLGLALRDGDQIDCFLQWLVESRSNLKLATAEDKEIILQIVKEWSWTCKDNLQWFASTLRQLCIFKGLSRMSSPDDTSIIHSWTDLTDAPKVIGLEELNALPHSSSITFLDASDEGERTMLRKLDLARCLTPGQLLEELVIPSLKRGEYGKKPREVVQMLFRDFFTLSKSCQKRVAQLPVVPLEMKGASGSQDYAPAASLVEPNASALRRLFFDNESMVPNTQFCSQFFGVLKHCGMKAALDAALLNQRLEIYASELYTFDEVAQRAQALLQLPLQLDPSNEKQVLQSIRVLLWLPAFLKDQSRGLSDAANCRDLLDAQLVNHVMPTLQFQVDSTWRPVLGWNEPISIEYIVSQLVAGIDNTDLGIVNATLSYIAIKFTRMQYFPLLRGLRIIWSSSKCFVEVTEAYREGCGRLSPYLYNVDSGFWSQHSKLLINLGVAQRPKLEDLHKTQIRLGKNACLEQAEMNVALEITRMFSAFPAKSCQNFEVPAKDGSLVKIADVVYNDLGPISSEHEFTLSHPGISLDVIKRLGIQPLSQKIRNGDLGISDLDEDEFDQREEVTDGIKDALERYPKTATFNEYLANADDCGSATSVNWLLDEHSYSTQRLLTPELGSCQGASLLAQNNGGKYPSRKPTRHLFQDKDFEGLKHVGRGSKRDDPTTIGKFGRGSQTMYHWTDTPMILSGDYLLILDPQQHSLPYNYRTGRRKAGVKVKLSKLKNGCYDQLAPFDGLWGYSRNFDRYEGTIFRFPLRREGSQSELLETTTSPSPSTVRETFRACFDDARLSLLFLRNIKEINFQVKNKDKDTPQAEWHVSRVGKPNVVEFSNWVTTSVMKVLSDSRIIRATDTWWRTIKNMEKVPEELQHRHKRTMKYVECGIAVLIKSEPLTPVTEALEVPVGRFFNCLPLPFLSHLPVHVHATFLLSGDRQSIAIERTTQDSGSSWNRWLLEMAIPDLYFEFLEDVGRKIGGKLFDYFPSPKDSGNSLSDLVRASFWQKLPGNPRRIFPVIDDTVYNDLPAKAMRPQRGAPQLVTIGEGIFELLFSHELEGLKPLLTQWVHPLIRPPQSLHKIISSVPSIRIITPAYVREILRVRKNSEDLLMLHQKDNSVLRALLTFITPKEDELTELHGCAILPLADGTLGTLADESQKVLQVGLRSYFSANTEHRELFKFASGCLSLDEANPRFIKVLLDSKRFNIQKLEKSHVGRLLECRKSWPLPNAEQKEWLVRFWTFMNFTPSVMTEAANVNSMGVPQSYGIDRFPVHEVRNGALIQYFNAEELADMPALIDPAEDSHRKLCNSLSGLYIISPETVPTYLRMAEKTLTHSRSLCRLLKAIKSLANGQDQSVSFYIKMSISDEYIKVLQQLVLEFCSSCTQKVLESGIPVDTLRELPLWPSVSNSNTDFMTSWEARTPTNHLLLEPQFAKEYDRFIDPAFSSHHHSSFRYLRIRPLDDETMLKEHILPNLPSAIDIETMETYRGLMTALSVSIRSTKVSREFVATLRNYKIAPRRDGTLCPAPELYDHEDAIYQAAFRSDPATKFLAREIEFLKPFWSECGLRGRLYGKMAGDNYLACLLAISEGFKAPKTHPQMSDVSVVLGPLCTDDYIIRDLSGQHWERIATTLVFPTQVHFMDSPTFRRARMEVLAGQQAALRPSQIFQHKYVSICWSQVPFATHEPSLFCLEKCGSEGRPAIDIVWQHLVFLAEVAQTIDSGELEDFLTDLRSTYDYLQDRILEARTTFDQPEAVLWLNIDLDASQSINFDEFKASWRCLEHLILLSACDAPPLMSVRSFLLPYDKLLKGVGCKSMIYPVTQSSIPERLEAVATGLSRLRKDNVMIDVTFSAEGYLVTAHKLVLAACSSYCEAQFSGSWNTDNTIVLEDMTPQTLKTLTNFAYQDVFDWSTMRVHEGDDETVIADKLDVLLDIVVGADRWMMSHLLEISQQQILGGNRLFIRPDNVQHVERVAKDANAVALSAYCSQFIDANKEAVVLANDDFVDAEDTGDSGDL
ncbi:MAG: hypothetical protein M1827_004446 [Pycnora praestabilis]|nr:MAG: hypothetical protein M1827_004446 [Pycnora praestabilis]